eukprot:TRINITY_DN11756_c0_g1_i1.p1 TRINITY_DN11756_c0_g1~~TRINITY_DN11756_c0_g1_i1.p1  ORF type:complete len:189 (-),score=28.37 TRINITY_DN11756_c0_g1_i1:85-651(-)
MQAQQMAIYIAYHSPSLCGPYSAALVTTYLKAFESSPMSSFVAIYESLLKVQLKDFKLDEEPSDSPQKMSSQMNIIMPEDVDDPKDDEEEVKVEHQPTNDPASPQIRPLEKEKSLAQFSDDSNSSLRVHPALLMANPNMSGENEEIGSYSNSIGLSNFDIGERLFEAQITDSTWLKCRAINYPHVTLR